VAEGMAGSCMASNVPIMRISIGPQWEGNNGDINKTMTGSRPQPLDRKPVSEFSKNTNKAGLLWST
jgi:hypothetical protein